MAVASLVRLGAATALFACLVVTARELGAQGVPPASSLPPAGRGTIVGIVVDTGGRPVDNAQLLLITPRRQVITNRDGTFRMNDVGDGVADLTVRKIGYHPVRTRFEIATAGSTVRLELVPLVRTLASVVTTARRSGLSGLVLGADGYPVAGVEVRVIGSGAGLAHTDTMGMFFTPVKTGHYLVELKREGYIPQMVSATIPDGEGRHLDITLVEGMSLRAARHAAIMDDLRTRLVNRRPAYSRLFTREDITKWNPADFRQLATIGAMARVDESCDVLIDGGIDRLPAWAVDLETIEFVEVYAQAPPRRAITSISRGATAPIRTQQRQSNAPGACPAQLYVWTRR